MRRKSSGTSGSPSGFAGQAVRPNRRIWVLGALAVLLPWLAAAASGQTEPGQTEPGQTEPGQTEPRQTDPGKTYPGESGLGPAAPWSVEGRPAPRGSRPKTVRDREREEGRDLWDEYWSQKKKQPVRCKILEVEDLGRLYVEDVSGLARGVPYWVQLPKEVKLLAEDPTKFDGRKKLKLEDLEVGQLLLITLRPKDGEILKVKVRPPQEPPP